MIVSTFPHITNDIIADFTRESCWLLAVILSQKLDGYICHIRDQHYIHHVAIMYQNRYIDITGVYTEEEFLHLWQTFKNNTDLKASIATREQIENMMRIKFKTYNISSIEDHRHYELACQCADFMVSML